MIVLVTWVSLALHVRLALGHWPKPMYESYDSSAYIAHGWLFLGSAFFACCLAAPLWVIGLRFSRFQMPRQTQYVQVGLFLIGWLLFYLYVKIDPGAFSVWFLD